jgi:hypothetical protein
MGRSHVIFLVSKSHYSASVFTDLWRYINVLLLLLSLLLPSKRCHSDVSIFLSPNIRVH